ncbi:MAG: hydrogenase maturation protease [Myxococcota bacterium]|jgi:hydrogenase maturation protease|nr:hydrogenase maturation protease [Myxococcota bacterium]
MELDWRIVCIGSRFEVSDCAAFLVYEELGQQALPPGVELLDGGLGGLALLPLFEGCAKLVFVDATQGFGAPASQLLLSGAEVAALATPEDGHQAGLPYLLRVAELVVKPLPQIWVLGLEYPWTTQSISLAADFLRTLCSPTRTRVDKALESA